MKKESEKRRAKSSKKTKVCKHEWRTYGIFNIDEDEGKIFEGLWGIEFEDCLKCHEVRDIMVKGKLNSELLARIRGESNTYLVSTMREQDKRIERLGKKLDKSQKGL